jgi:hypothetical protein
MSLIINGFHVGIAVAVPWVKAHKPPEREIT